RSSGDVDEVARPVIDVQQTARTVLARGGNVEIPVVVDIDQLEIPTEPDKRWRHLCFGGVGEHGGAVVEPQRHKPAWPERRTVTPVGDDDVEILVAINVAD